MKRVTTLGGRSDGENNGGLPTFNIGGLNQLGTRGFSPTYKNSNVWDYKENVTKIKSPHIVKFGFEYQNVFVPYLVPPRPRGQFNFSGDYTSIPGVNLGSTGRAQVVLKPIRLRFRTGSTTLEARTSSALVLAPRAL